MSRLGITFEQVELAAEKVLDNGENPTIERVRAILGGTGSNTTIAKHLNEWKSQRLRASTQDLPPRIETPDPVNKAVSMVWQQIRDEAHAEIKTINEQAKTQIEAMQQACVLAEDERDRLQNELNALQKTLEKLTRQTNEYQAALNTEQHQRELAEEAVKHRETLYNTMKQETEQRLSAISDEKQKQLLVLQEQQQKINDAKNKEIQDLKESLATQQTQYLAQIQTAQTEFQNTEKELLKLQLIEQQVQIQCQVAKENATSFQGQLLEANHKLEQVTKQLHEQASALSQSQTQAFSFLQMFNERELRLQEQQQFILELQNSNAILQSELMQCQKALIDKVDRKVKEKEKVS